MHKKIAFYNRISVRILAVLLILFSIAAAIISIINKNNIQHLYEETFTERVLLTNALMATIIDSDDVGYFVDLITNQDDEFKQRQVQYYHDRLTYWELQAKGAPDEELEELSNKLRAFHNEMNEFKDEKYWETVDTLNHLKEISNSTYLYVMADTGIVNNDGEPLYSFIFDADDYATLYDEITDVDGLGTSDTSQDTIKNVYDTKKQMDHVEYYNDVYGELYYAYAPIIKDGEVIAVFATDLSLDKMNASISSSTFLFNIVFFIVFILIILILFIFLRHSFVTQMQSLTNTAYELAEGHIYVTPPKSTLKQKSEIGLLAHAVNDMSLAYQNIISNARNLFAAASIGKLNIRSETSEFKGDIADFIKQINETLDATTLYLNSIPESIFIMNKDFDIYFKNNSFDERFGDMPAQDIISLMFPSISDAVINKDAFLKETVLTMLKEENNNSSVWINDSCYSIILKEINLDETVENSILVIAIDITDLMNEKENAQAAAEAKSSFLSRMSHEMRTPMNAIIGMTKIAENTNDVSKLKYCIETIDISSRHLLNIINDVLDMSKIAAGKFELEHLPLNIEKTLMKVCNIVIDNVEKKHQKFNVILSKDLDLNYMGDELKLSQVLTNLLSNAVKFTPEQGKITLSVDKAGQYDNINTLRFVISDTGIGMTQEQISRLWTAFEQADGSVSRKYGGTGLGLAISKNIVEKMGGHVWVESVVGVGSTFGFEINLERASHQGTIIFDGIRPQDLKLLIVESDDDVRGRFLDIVNNFGMSADSAKNSEEALKFAESAYDENRVYDIIFLDYNISGGMNSFDIIKQLGGKIDKNTVIIITTFLEWHQIENESDQFTITRYITKPLFPSSILDAINDVVGRKLKSLDIKTDSLNEVPDLSGVHIILAEDMEINREIVISLLEPTNVTIESAVNGEEAVEIFKQNPAKYDMIFMDIQMPEMDGYTATKNIRELNFDKAKEIPIVAMTANVFKEDIDKCLEAGMNDHVGKPLSFNEIINKLNKYVSKRI